MAPAHVQRTQLFLLAVVLSMVLWALPVSPAHAATPSITATSDAETYGVLLIAGQGFTPRTTATIQVHDADAGALLVSVSAKVDRLGAFLSTVSFTLPSGAPLVERAAIQATDASNATTDALVVTLSPPAALVRAHLAGVQQALADALASVDYWVGVVAQNRHQWEAALQALQTAERGGAPGGVIQKLQDALTAASQSYGAALQGLAAANATVDQLEAAANSLQQDLNQG